MEKLARDPELIDLGGHQSVGSYLADVWSRREYMMESALGTLRAAHLNTVLGNVWHILNPLMLVGVYYLIFGVVLETDRGVDNFIAYLAVGIFSFRFTRSSIQRGAGSIARNDSLIRSIYFPRAVLPISTTLEQLYMLIPSLIVVLAISLITGEPVRVTWLALPAIFGVQALFSLGGAFIAARITDTFRDFENVLPYLFRILFYASGVLFSVDYFVTDPTMRSLFNANPLYAFITLARWAILDEPAGIAVVISALAWTVGLLVFGFVFFHRAEHRYGRG